MIKKVQDDLGKSTPTLSCSHHDYRNPKRLGRARYHCPKCGADISMEVILIAIAELESEENENFWKSKQLEVQEGQV